MVSVWFRPKVQESSVPSYVGVRVGVRSYLCLIVTCFPLAGERCQKDIYEALRAGKGWGKTLFLIVYDDAGGTYDHVRAPTDWLHATCF